MKNTFYLFIIYIIEEILAFDVLNIVSKFVRAREKKKCE